MNSPFIPKTEGDFEATLKINEQDEFEDGSKKI
jgi:hypothetical protein